MADYNTMDADSIRQLLQAMMDANQPKKPNQWSFGTGESQVPQGENAEAGKSNPNLWAVLGKLMGGKGAGAAGAGAGATGAASSAGGSGILSTLLSLI